MGVLDHISFYGENKKKNQDVHIGNKYRYFNHKY